MSMHPVLRAGIVAIAVAGVLPAAPAAAVGGQPLWTATVAGPDVADYARGVAVDPARPGIGVRHGLRGGDAGLGGDHRGLRRRRDAVVGGPRGPRGLRPAGRHRGGPGLRPGLRGRLLGGVPVRGGRPGHGRLRAGSLAALGREHASNSALAVDPSGGGVVVVSVRDSSAVPPEPPSLVVRRYDPDGTEQ